MNGSGLRHRRDRAASWVVPAAARAGCGTARVSSARVSAREPLAALLLILGVGDHVLRLVLVAAVVREAGNR